ncbi:hypothetical protein C9374_005400 [Naegleria lovaniensis]|uniref:Uncharacterized protein n=1 Tax=Naegleria lovaniensis TaxID=51637 RepID=A0AA88GQA2_NAELO|nr:uncharacterized protein C9374_005400 [Naegleria lovaniensis]KAG2382198.1 hypothetical protein C9374_005400 [Naegleria lovaniensis]
MKKASSSTAVKNKRSDSPSHSPPTSQQLPRDDYVSPVGMEKRKRKEEFSSSAAENRKDDRSGERRKKKRKSSRGGSTKETEHGSKFCASIPLELDDSKRLVILNEIWLKHAEDRYCKIPIVKEAFDEIKREYLTNTLPKLIEKYNGTRVIPNLVNQANRSKEQFYDKTISQLEKELQFWDSIASALEKDSDMTSKISDIKMESFQPNVEQKTSEMLSMLTKLLNGCIESTVVLNDHLNMFIEAILQAKRDATNLQQKVFHKMKEQRKPGSSDSKATTNDALVSTILNKGKNTRTEKKDQANALDPKTIIGEKDFK